MIRAVALALSLLVLSAPLPAQQVPDPISRSELGTIRSEGGNAPNADAITRFYTYSNIVGDNTSLGNKPQFEVASEPDASDWAIEQPGKQNQGATRLCTTSLGTTSDCNYVSLGKNSRHLFANGAGTIAEMGFSEQAIPPATNGYSNGWVKLWARNDAIAQISAAGTTNVGLELTTKGNGADIRLTDGNDGPLATFTSGGTGSIPYVFTTGFGTTGGSLISGFGGIRIEGQRRHIISQAAAYNVTSASAGAHYDNQGASASVTFTLPVAAVGNNYCFSVDAAFPVVIKANVVDKIALAPVNSAFGGTLTSSTVFASVCLVARKPTQWIVYSTPDKTHWVVL